MFPPVESQVIFLSNEIPIVNVGLRTGVPVN
jgi:D-hexose-6-phosphate mutarotase